MAFGQRFNSRLIAAFAAAFLILPLISSAATTRPYEQLNRHPLSWESLKSREDMRQWRDARRSSRRAKLKKVGSVKLKKSTFWNKKSFQFSTPVVADSMLFVGVDAGVFYGIDAVKIKKIWQYRTEGPVQSQAAFDGGTVYFGDTKGFAYALGASDGKPVWKVFLDSAISAAPLILGDSIYLLGDSGRLYALKKDTGDEAWHTETLEKGVGFSVKRSSSPSYSGGLIFFGTATGMLMAYRDSGTIAWVRQIGDRQTLVFDVDDRPLAVGNLLYVTSADNKLFCLNPSNGDVVWSNTEVGGVNDIALDGSKLYVAGNGVLAAVDSASGDMLWEQDFETPDVSSPVIDKDIIVVVSTTEKLYLVDAGTGDIIYDRNVRSGSFGDPIFSDGRLYFVSNKGRLYSFRITEKPPKGAKKKK